MTKIQAAKLVALLLAGFPSAKFADASSALYERMLSDLDVDAATAAVEYLIATSKFFPSVAEVMAATIAMALGDVRPGGEAWGEVLAAVSRYGQYRTPEFTDPIVDRAVSIFGWGTLCRSESATSDRARFIELYDQLARSDRRAVTTRGLPSGERYRRLQESGAARPVSEAVARLPPASVMGAERQ